MYSNCTGLVPESALWSYVYSCQLHLNQVPIQYITAALPFSAHLEQVKIGLQEMKLGLTTAACEPLPVQLL